MYDVAPTCSTQSKIGSRKNGTGGGAANGTSPATGGMSPTGTSPDGVVVVEDGVVDALGVVTGGNALIMYSVNHSETRRHALVLTSDPMLEVRINH
jgi:hypothetical protein